MNYLTRVLSSALLFVALCFLPGCVRQAQEKAPRFQVGAASAVVNPPVGAFIAGDKQNRRFTGVHDSLYVKAVVMYDGQSSLAILTVDCIGLMYPDLLRIRERVSAICDFPAERIILSSTHTHSGPDVVGLWGADYAHSGVDTAYQTFLIHTAARQIELADKAKREATVHVGETVFGEPWVQNICQEEIDRSLTMMQFKDAEGHSIASLTNFACHPTFLDAVFSEVSSDYLSTFYQTVNAGWGGTNLFLQGPIGGWVQPVEGNGSLEQAELRGRELGERVIAAMKEAEELTEKSIRFRSKEILLAVDNEAWRQLSAIGTVSRQISDSVQTEVAWFAIGKAQFATHPGETAPYYGLETKKLMKSGPKFVLGLGNDALGYILKPAFYEDSTRLYAEYLTQTSVGKNTAPVLMKTLEELIPEKP